MKTYREYKDSGVQWIGKVPSHWEILAFKYCMKINNGQDYKHILVDEGYPVFGSGGPFAFASQFIYDGEVVMLGRKGTIDKPLYYKGKFWTVDTMFYAIPTKRSVCRFMYYLARTFPFSYYSTATALPSMTQFDLGNNPIALPPLPEQQAIASYLDAKTKSIDDIIAKREKQIELLEEMKSTIISRAVTKGLNPEAQMKDSGIEWIGEIPEGWDVIKTSFLFQLIGSGTTPSKNAPNYAEEGLYWLQTGDFNDNYVNDTSKYITDLAVQNCSALTLFPKGCLVIAMYGASIGKLGILNIESYTNQACCVLGREKNILIKFAFYAYKAGRKALINESRGGGQPNISQDIISHFKIPVPPINEQCNVIAYLDSETSKIGTRIAKRRKQIELLQEYKQALITAAVTGKIDVRDYIS